MGSKFVKSLVAGLSLAAASAIADPVLA